MKVFTCTDFPGEWPVGVAAVVVADSLETAHNMMAFNIHRRGFPVGDFTLREIDLTKQTVYVLNDGQY
jgi:hypothetical protein